MLCFFRSLFSSITFFSLFSCAFERTHIYMYTHIYIHIYICIYIIYLCVPLRTRMQWHGCDDPNPQIWGIYRESLNHANPRTHKPTHQHKLTTHTNKLAHTHANAHMQTHTCKRTHTYKHAHTHIHTHMHTHERTSFFGVFYTR